MDYISTRNQAIFAAKKIFGFSHCPLPNLTILATIIFNPDRSPKIPRTRALWKIAFDEEHQFIDEKQVEREFMNRLGLALTDDKVYREHSLILYGNIILPILAIPNPFDGLKTALIAYLILEFGETYTVLNVIYVVEEAVKPYMNKSIYPHDIIFRYARPMFEAAKGRLLAVPTVHTTAYIK